MAVVRGRAWDKASGRPLEARVRLRGSTGLTYAPADAVHKHGPGEPFFFCPGAFEVDVIRGQLDVLVERGTEYRPLELVVDVPPSGVVELELPLERWVRPAEQGWYAGNTHVHYDETEERPFDRLRLDPRVEDLPVFVVSQLKRRELPYASNAFPIGRHHFSTHDHVIDVGEESRHNYHDDPWRIALGHIMLINLREVVEPISRGVLVDDAAPDYPPLVDACDGARGQGGVVLWCHNANGMEAPVAAALGRLDGLNLFDPYWMDPEYELWYRLLNCGIRLPASTGSDWFVCSANRVYVDVGSTFSYESWLAGLKAGRTLVTDGPILRLTVEAQAPSNELLAVGGGTVEVAVEWEWHQPVDRVEIVRDGEVVAAIEEGTAIGGTTLRLDAAGVGWVAARAWGRRRNSYGHALWAHTSPVYLRARPEAARVRDAASFFLERLDRARDWIGARARFDDTTQRDRMLQLFAEGRLVYEGLARA